MEYVDPASEEHQKELEDALEAIGIAVGVSSLLIIAQALERITEDTTISDALAMLGADMKAFEKVVQQGREDYKNTIEDMYETLAVNNDEWAEVYYAYSKVKQIPAAIHPKISKIFSLGEKKAIKAVKAMCNTSVLGLVDRNGEFVPFEDEYKRIINRAINSMKLGETSYTTEVKRVCKELSNTGLRVQYESGVTRELFGAARTNLMDGYRDTMMEVRYVQGKEFGADGVELSAHALCAKDHQDYQGNQYSYERRRGYELWSEVQNEPDRPLVTGANCGHTIYPVLLDVTEPAHSKSELAELKRRANEKISFAGMSGKTLTMSRYDATQYQRGVERRIRSIKTDSKLLESAGNKDAAKQAKSNAREYTAYYKAMSEEAGLTTRLERTRAYVLN